MRANGSCEHWFIVGICFLFVDRSVTKIFGGIVFSMMEADNCFSSLQDRKSTRLNSSHVSISYAVFCLKKKTNINKTQIFVSALALVKDGAISFRSMRREEHT